MVTKTMSFWYWKLWYFVWWWGTKTHAILVLEMIFSVMRGYYKISTILVLGSITFWRTKLFIYKYITYYIYIYKIIRVVDKYQNSKRQLTLQPGVFKHRCDHTYACDSVSGHRSRGVITPVWLYIYCLYNTTNLHKVW